MPTYSPEQALARPNGRAPLWGEGLLAAALWLLGGLFTLTWPDAGRRWPFSEGWALAQFTLGGGLLLALSYRYWRARGARVLHAGKWLALLPVLFAVWEGLTAKTAVLPVPFFAPPQALIEVLHDDCRACSTACCTPWGCWGSVCCWVPAAGSSPVWPSAGRNGLATGCIRCYVCWGRCRPPRCCRCACLFSLELRRQRVFDRAEHLVPGHGADLVRSDGH
ncbi:alkanesulfonates transport system permease protein [Klebsiella pneumoniae subsp. rhinoscleromatis]|nr:alkanesulfonates transport system permease protein [Klebsiella pneumoniae subsp. rhinoscleromatis]